MCKGTVLGSLVRCKQSTNSYNIKNVTIDFRNKLRKVLYNDEYVFIKNEECNLYYFYFRVFSLQFEKASFANTSFI
jgi:hypothetical protein